MSFTVIVLIFILIIFALFIRGVFSFKQSRTKGLILMLPLVLITLLAVGAYNWFSHTTTPDSLELQVHEQNQKYKLKGQWQERQDPYSYGTDLLVFFAPDNQKIELNNKTGEEKQIPEGLLAEAVTVLRKNNNYPNGLEPQIYQIKVQKNFVVDFVVPDSTLDEVIIQYVHIVMEPMSPTTYWVKDLSTFSKQAK